jgi:hypothetical protein
MGNALAQKIPPLPGQWDLKKITLAGRIYIPLGIALFFGLILRAGILTYLQAGHVGRALLKRELGPLELGFMSFRLGLYLIVFVIS